MKRVVGAAGRLADGGTVEVVVRGRPYVLRAVDGRPVAHERLCPHRGGPLDEAHVVEGTLICTWHRSVFRGADGERLYGPARCGIRTRTARFDGRDVLVDDEEA